MKWWIVVIIVLVAGVAAFAGGMSYEKNKKPKADQAPVTT